MINVGDVVTLNSGSPQMTVENFSGFGRNRLAKVRRWSEEVSTYTYDGTTRSNTEAYFRNDYIREAALKRVN